jgi:uncharacterized protein YjbI with pentapeptide repeats
MMSMSRAPLPPGTAKKIVAVLLLIGLVAGLGYLGSAWLWWWLANYIQPQEPTEKKELVNVFVLIVGGVIGFLIATAAIGTLYMSRKNLQQQRELDERQAQDEALQAYYEQMGTLLSQYNLMTTSSDNPLRLLARAQTLTVLGRVNAQRKRDLIRFLHGARLIASDGAVVVLTGADLREADLYSVELYDANLSYANLNGAELRGANLNNSDLSNSNLSNANLYNAQLDGADLSKADLSKANLYGAHLSFADLRHAFLNSANLRGANLRGANLRGADLRGADLNNTNLSYADLNGAKVSDGQLQLPKTLAGTVLPNGIRVKD